ncbi:MAG: glycosyltransferase family 4 protein [Nocardioidaceae bacterium]|nr:glycosyltransferase family 4 protein [Nocardioidaceae bacterium]
MRILQLHNHHANKGGAMEVLAHESSLLKAAGHDVDEYTVAATEDLSLSSMRAGIKAIWNQQVASDLNRRIATLRPDVVHVHTPFPIMSPVVFRVAHKRGIPVVTTLHSYRYSCIAGTCWRDGHVCEDCIGKKLKLPGVRHQCYHDSAAASASLTLSLGAHRGLGTFHQHVSRYLTLTDFSRRLLIRDGFPADRITVKPNSVPDPGVPASRGSGERLVAFAGRLIDIKGVRTLLDAWARVPAGMKLVIAGDGPLRGLVEERAASDTSIEFVGWVDEDQVLDLMGQAEVVVVPSEWYEGLPLVILRSLAVGTPILVSNLDNCCEVVEADGVGWTFQVKDSHSLVEQLTRLVLEPSHAAALRNAARQSYERRYSPPVDLIRLERVYREVIEQT